MKAPMSKHKERAAKAKATVKAKAEEYKSQTIRINDVWSVIRLDDLNWQIRQKGKKQPWDRWYYGTVQGALYDVFKYALNEEPHKWRRDLVPLAEKIQGCLDRLEAKT